MYGHGTRKQGVGSGVDVRRSRAGLPGKQTLTAGLEANASQPPGGIQLERNGGAPQRDPAHAAPLAGPLPSLDLVQRKAASPRAGGASACQGKATEPATDAAARGIAGSSHPLPHGETIQHLFGNHDIRNIQAHTDESAAAGARAMGADAFATGNHVAFASTPDLHTAAHEAAHVVQQRAGVHLKNGVGERGDSYERNADEVADRVVQGLPAHDLLPAPAQSGAGRSQHEIQRQEGGREMTPEEVAEALRWVVEGDEHNGGKIGFETINEVQRVCGLPQNGDYDEVTARAVFAKEQELNIPSPDGKAGPSFCQRTGIIFTNPITDGTVTDDVLQAVEQRFPQGVTVAIYPDSPGYSEFRQQAEEIFAPAQQSVGVQGGAVVLGLACPIKELGDIIEVVQSIHRGLVQKWMDSRGVASGGDRATARITQPAFTKVRNLALFSHGESYGMGLNAGHEFYNRGLHNNETPGTNGLNPPNIEAFVRGLSDAVVPDVRVELFGCSAGADPDRYEWGLQEQGDRAGAGSMASSLAQAFGPEATVLAHTTAGHATTNFAARVFGAEAGAGPDGIALFDILYPESYVQSELERLYPDLSSEERAAYHDDLRSEMWDHYRDAVHDHPDRLPVPMGQEIFINPDNARTLLHDDWEANWIPEHLDEVQPE